MNQNSSMTYIFLTYTMKGVAGNALYIEKKMEWLKSKGCKIVVFDHYGPLNTIDQIDIERLKQYKNNRKLEMFFPPAYYTTKQRKKVLDWLCERIPSDNDYVVESNTTRMALWGELLSERIKAKHLIFDVNEHPELRSFREFKFLDFKLKRQELFFITARVAQIFFKEFREINDSEAKLYSYDAVQSSDPQEIPLPILDRLPVADYKILSFGRTKPYFRNMVEGLVEFANKHKEKKINFISLGDVADKDIFPELLETAPNIYYKLLPAMNPIPRAIFRYSDAVIATSGCAGIAMNQNVKTISINIENNKPFGVLGYTTIDSSFSTGENDVREVCELLEEILIYKKYEGEPLLKRKPSERGLDFQFSRINNDRVYWKYICNIPQDRSIIKRLLEKCILRLGCISVFVNRIERVF